MKTSFSLTRSCSQVTAFLMILGGAASSLSAANRYWDPNGSDSGAGGAGTWQLGTPALWNNASNGSGSLFTWANNLETPDIAYFGGTVGTGLVNVVSSTENPIVAGTLIFSTVGYQLSGGAITIPTSITQTLIEIQSGGGDTSIGNDLRVLVPATSSGPRYRIINRSAGTLTFSGNTSLILTEPTENPRTYDIDQFHADGKIILNGTFGESEGSGTTTLRFGENGGVSGAVYEVNGNNIDAFDAGSRVHRGTVLIGHANALGGTADKAIRVGSQNTAAGQTAAALTNGAFTIVNNVFVAGGSASLDASYVIGGATADASTFSGTVTVNNDLPLTLRAAAGGTVTFSGLISRGAAEMIKDGAGTVSLTNADGNTGTGDMKVSAGTLLVTNTEGSAHGTGNLTVETGATLGGTGFLAASAVGSKITLQGGSTLLGGLGAGATGVLTVQGNVEFLSNSVIKLVLGPGQSTSSIARSSGTWSFQADQLFTFDLLEGAEVGTYANILTGIAAGTNVSGWRIAASSGLTGSFELSGTNVNVVINAIPEPTSLLLVTAGISLIWLRRRRTEKRL